MKTDRVLHSLVIAVIVAGIFLCGQPNCYGIELTSRYATIVYDSRDDLEEFNDNLYLGRKLGYLAKQQRAVTVEDEVRAKVDVVVDKVKEVLDMYPEDLKFTIRIFKDTDGVQAVYLESYGRKVDYIAFYSLVRKILFIAATKANLHVFAHEIGHVVVDRYFKVRPPYKIHEVMAQYAEAHIND